MIYIPRCAFFALLLLPLAAPLQAQQAVGEEEPVIAEPIPSGGAPVQNNLPSLPQAPVPAAGGSSGSYVREVFQYPRFARPNPVQPPAVLMQENAFRVIELSGILYDDKDPTKSQAVIRMAGEGAGARPQRFFVRRGDRIGDNYLIALITRSEVHVDEMRFGGVRRVVLEQGENTSEGRSATTSPSSSQDN